jgi:hypothetical protein
MLPSPGIEAERQLVAGPASVLKGRERAAFKERTQA